MDREEEVGRTCEDLKDLVRNVNNSIENTSFEEDLEEKKAYIRKFQIDWREVKKIFHLEKSVVFKVGSDTVSEERVVKVRIKFNLNT